jgi:hypothetical protein
MASVADFQERFPEFCGVDDDRVQMFLDDTALLMNSPDKWVGFYEVAHMYHTAHFIVVSESTESGDSGILAPVKHQEVDDVVIKNAIGDVDVGFDDLYSTSYGKRYISYRRIAFAGVYGV